jgi:hypothetical protein
MTNHPNRRRPATIILTMSEPDDAAQDVAVEAFEAAIATKRLSADESAENYAGAFMFMGYQGKALFKHITSRRYLP